MKVWPVLAGVLLAAACAGNELAPGELATVQLLQADPGAPATVAFTIDQNVVATSVAFGFSSPEVETTAGTHQFGIESFSGPLATIQSELRAGKRYYLVSAGGSLVLTEAASVDSSGHTIPPDTGQRNPARAHLRLVNIPGPGAEPPDRVDLLLQSPATVDSTVRFGLDTRIASYSSLIYLNPGAVSLRLVPAGQSNLLADASFTIALGEVKDVVIERDSGGSLRLRIVVEQ